MDLFHEEREAEAISRIKKFAIIAKKMGYPISVGFSGGKDSQVVYDLCKRAGVEFTAYFNHSFESTITLNFIRDNYPDVIKRREHKYGFIQNIIVNHGGMLPSITKAYCCDDYKHNKKYVDKISILGIRRAESHKRATRTTLSIKNKTTQKGLKPIVNEYFKEQCQSTGAVNILTLNPIIEWTDREVWEYIHKNNLPINPEYKEAKRVGCIVCPKANFTSNYRTLLKYPKLIDCFIRARETGERQGWVITGDNKDYSDDKIYYICRWLNHSFMPFTKKQEEYYKQVKQRYYETTTNSTNNSNTNVTDSRNECNTQHNRRL